MLYPTYSFPTAKGTLQLTCLYECEPNNGRMLYEVKLSLDEADLTQQYFDGWNYINTALDRYILISHDKKWIYIPKEGDHFLINADTLEKTALPPLELSATSFIGNAFIGDFLLVMGSEQMISKNLHTGSTAVLERPDAHTYFREVQIHDEHAITILLNNGVKDTVSLNTLQLIHKNLNNWGEMF